MKWLISSVQQYSIDRFRISMSKEYGKSEINKILFKIYDSEDNDVSYKVKSVEESNNWTGLSSNYFDIYLNTDSFFDEGKYRVEVYYDTLEKQIYTDNISIEYMEDIRVEFYNTTQINMHQLSVSFRLLEGHSQYQSLKMLKMMNFSLMSEDSTNYSDVFESLSDALDRAEDPTKGFCLELKEGKTLPSGYFTMRLATPYKSRTFSIVSDDVSLEYMTTTPPSFGSVMLSKNANGEIVLNITFSSYIEQRMFETATRHIYDPDGDDVTTYFDSNRISVTNMTIVGIRYISKVESPLSSNHYTLKKGEYKIEYNWSGDLSKYYPEIVYTTKFNWCLQQVKSVTVVDTNYLEFKLPSFIDITDLNLHNFDIEIDGESASSEAFGKITDIDDDTDPEASSHFKINIINLTKIKDGMYSFIFYHYNSGVKEYDYIGQFSFKDAWMPIVTEVYKNSIDSVTVALKNKVPIKVLEYCSAELYDSYGSIDFSSRLDSITNSNVWEAGQTNADRFNINVKGDSTISSGSYMFNLVYGTYHLDKISLSLQYTESRRGLINSIEQSSLSEMTIHFSEAQSRQFLMSTTLNVQRKSDGMDVTDSFELLENVVKADKPSFKDLTIPVRANKSVPAGKYTVTILYQAGEKSTSIVYACDANLGYMLYVSPEVLNITSEDITDNKVRLTIEIDHLLEEDLIKDADFGIYFNGNAEKILENNIAIAEVNQTLMKQNATYNDNTSDITYLQNRIEQNTAILKDNEEKLPAMKEQYEADMKTLDTASDKLSKSEELLDSKLSELNELNSSLRYYNSELIRNSGIDDQKPIDEWTSKDKSNTYGDYGVSLKRDISNYTAQVNILKEKIDGLKNHPYSDKEYGNFSTSLELPKTSQNYVKDYYPDSDTLVLCFEFGKYLERSFFDNLEVKVFDSVGHECTEYFDTIANSNTFDTSASSFNEVNVNVMSLKDIVLGTYSFVFYHIIDGARISCYEGDLDIRTAIKFKIDSLTDEETSIEKDLDKTTESLDHFNEFIKELDKKDELLTKIDSIKIDVSSTKIEVNKISEIVTADNKNIESLESANELIKIQNSNDTEDVKRLESDNSSLKETIDSLQEELNELIRIGGTLKSSNVTKAFEPIENWTYYTYNLNGIVTVGKIYIETKKDVIIESGEYNAIFSWAETHPYLEDLTGEFELDYSLPKTVDNEVVAYDPSKDIVRLYFEFDKYLQRSFFTSLEVKVYDSNGDECTDYFDTIANSNTFDEGIESFNSVNLNVLSLSDIQLGVYSFIFYHMVDGVQSSCYEGLLDIRAAISPYIQDIVQSMNDLNEPCLHVTLRKAAPRQLLENYSFKFKSFKNVDYTSYFRTIPESNNWSVDVREISEFDVVLKTSYKLDDGNYSFRMFAGETLLDQADVSLTYMENTKISITGITIVNLSTIMVNFAQMYPKELLRTMSLVVINENGDDVSTKFKELSSTVLNVTEDETNNIKLSLNDDNYLEKGLYYFEIQSEVRGEIRTLTNREYNLPYLTTNYPILYEVEATKIQVSNKERDGIIMWFEPALELEEFNNISNFKIETISGIDITHKFVSIEDAILDTTEVGNTTFINYATLQFIPTEVLKKSEYLITLDWNDNKEYSFMKALTREVSLEYILLPVKNITMPTIDEVKVFFDDTRSVQVTKEKIKNCELEVTAIYQKETEDGEVTVDVNFTEFFKDLSETNDFDKMTDPIESISIQLKDGKFLPSSTYRFIIKEKLEDEETQDLRYAYSGSYKVNFMINKEVLNCESTIKQTSYNTLTMTFDKNIPVDILNASTFHIVKDQYDFINMFKGITASNYYEIRNKATNEIEESGYYQNATVNDLVVQDIIYKIKETNQIKLVLNNNSAIPRGTYNTSIIYESNTYFKNTLNTRFMTDSVPKIMNAEIANEDTELVLTFDPNAELYDTLESNFSIGNKTRVKRDADGNVLTDEETGEILYERKDLTGAFGNVISSTMEQTATDIGITYVPTIHIPINKNVALPCGEYRITWDWGENSFFPKCIYDGALKLVSKGIKSVSTYDMRTLKIVFDEEYKGSYIKGLTLGVKNSMDIDVSGLFQSMEDGNTDITDDEETDTFYIRLSAGSAVPEDSYMFTLSLESEGEDPELDVITEVFTFEMSIVYLADAFPGVEIIDNVSGESYEIIDFTNSNASSYIGRDVQLMTDAATKMKLTEDLLEDFIGNSVKVYSKPEITTLTMILNEEINPCVLLASEVSIINSDGANFSDYFKTPAECNTYNNKKVLDYIDIVFKTQKDPELLKRYEYEVFHDAYKSSENEDGEITGYFKSAIATNDFDDGIWTNTVKLYMDDDEYIEEYLIDKIRVSVTDPDVQRITGFSIIPHTKLIKTTDRMEISLKSGMMFPSDTYSVSVSYTNEKNMTDAVYITPFTFNGVLPFLATKVGNVTASNVNLSTVKFVFTEDLPLSIFNDIDVEVLNEDKEDVSSYFMSFSESNDYGEAETISALSEPYTLYLKLELNQFITAGNYTFNFIINTAIGDEEDEEFESPTYTLWETATSLPYMINEVASTIKEVSITGIDSLKFTLSAPIDIEMLRNFKIEATNVANDYYIDTSYFKALSESNNFGRNIILTDNRYLLYNESGSYWSRFDTKKSTGFNDLYYDVETDMYLIITTSGSVLLLSDFSNETIKEYKQSESSLNAILPIRKGKVIIVGNNGVILICNYDKGSATFKKVESNIIGSNHLKDIAYGSNEIVAIGTNNTILNSKDEGETWNKCAYTVIGKSFNLNSIAYYDGVIESETDDAATTGTRINAGFYAVGNNGLILYASNASSEFKTIASGISNALYGITVHDETMIAVGDAGKIVITNDGETWSSVASGVSFTLRKICYCDTKFIACGATGKWITSASGQAWTVNSTIYSDSLKNVSYVKSQYTNNRSCDYFYVKLNDKKTIGSINYYTGTDEPDMTNSPAKSWVSDNIKKTHVGDIYNMFGVINGNTVIVKTYQFKTKTDTDGTIEFVWEDCTAIEPTRRATGTYIFSILLNDSESTLWNSSPETDITYLTTAPGDLTEASFKLDNTIIGTEGILPYIELKMDRGDEMVINYASYRILNSKGGDCSNYFKPLRESDIVYSSRMDVEAIKIYLNTNNIASVPADNYTIKWNWCTFSTDEISLPLVVHSIMPMISSIEDHYEGIDTLRVKFNRFTVKDSREKSIEMVPRGFFTDGETTTSLASVELYRYPEKTSDDDEVDYSSVFKDVLTTNVFTDDIVESLLVKVDEGSRLAKGKYIIKFTNSSYPVDNCDDYLVSVYGQFTLQQELLSTLPDISTVKVEQYTDVVEPIVDGRTPEVHSGTCEPSQDQDFMTLIANWEAAGTQNIHVGDTYTNLNTKETWSYVYDKINGQYRMDKNVPRGYLVITFGDTKPSKDAIVTSVSKITLTDVVDSVSVDYSDYLSKDVGEWDLDTVKMDNVLYVSKLRIPLDEARTFIGAEHATLTLEWTPDCIYKTLTISDLKLDANVVVYGNIKSVSIVNVPEVGSTDYETALLVKFEHRLLSSFLEKCTFTLVHDTTNAAGKKISEDVAGSFQSIVGANYDDLKANRTLDYIYLKLTDGNTIDGGKYDLTITGDKPVDDVSTGDDTVTFTHDVNIAWLTTEPPKDIGVKFEASKDKYIYPVLTLKFKEINPPHSVVNKASVTVTWESNSKTKDYSECFRPTSNNLVLFNFEDIKVQGTIGKWEDGGNVQELPAKHTVNWAYKVVTNGTYAGKSCKAGDWLMCIKTGTKSNNSDWKREAKGSDALNSRKVESIEIPLKRARALKAGLYDVVFNFNASAKMNSIPGNGIHRTFRLNQSVMSIIATLKKLKTTKHKKLTVTLSFAKGLKTNGEIRKSQIGKTLGVKTKTQLMKKIELSLMKGSSDKSTYFKPNPKVSGNNIIYTLRNNKKINPGTVSIKFKWHDALVVNYREIDDFNGLIIDKIGTGSTKHICFVLSETHDGRTRRKVYKTFAGAQARIKRLKALNAKDAKQYAKCKKCRKNKVFSTSKIKADMEKYDIPKKNKGTIRDFMRKAFSAYYHQYVKKTVKCSECEIITHPSDQDGYCYVYCDSYVKNKVSYTWNLQIATMATAWPKAGKTVYFAYIVKEDERFSRGFAGGTGTTKPKKFKSRIKAIKKYIKSYKKKVAVCKKCKKRTIAVKANTTIGWGQGMFAIELLTKTKTSVRAKIKKMVNKAFKKKNMGCSKANFKFVKKDNTHCRLSCSACKTTDSSMKYGSFKATMSKK